MVRKSFYLWESEIRGIPPMLQSLMIHVEFPAGVDVRNQKLPFFLATEEHLARNCRGEYFFMWQVEPTVIFGRNQNLEAEVNVAFCKEKGIATYRRKSGGGCVYADRNNIMFSHITSSDAVATTFSRFTGEVAAMLRGMGIVDAATTGRNDIMIGDRKVSGYAFYHIGCRDGSRAIVHGTMLYDADIDTMTRALTPSQVKLQAKGVPSVRKHVTTIREHSDVSLEAFKAHASSTLCSSSLTLTEADIEEIRRIEQGYYASDWILGRRRAGNAAPRRIEGVGEFVVNMRTNREPTRCIEADDLTGDFFITGDLDNSLIKPLTGAELTRDGLEQALCGIDTSAIIHNLSKHEFINLLLDAAPH